MRQILRSVLAAAALMLTAGHAEAAGAAFCQAYVDFIMPQIIENQTRACTFSGDRWGTDPEGHMRWCRQSTEAAVHDERKKRNIQASACHDCANYADTAVHLAQENTLFSCGNAGNRWGTDRNGHLQWCVNNYWGIAGESGFLGNIIPGMKEVVFNEQNARFAAIGQCKSDLTDAQIVACHTYADETVREAKANADGQCGGEGPRWSQDRDFHFMFCIGGSRRGIDGRSIIEVMADEKSARQEENTKCKIATVDYGDCPGCGPGLKPQPSTGESPFGGKDQDMRSMPSGTSGMSTVTNPAAALPVARPRKAGVPTGSSGADKARTVTLPPNPIKLRKLPTDPIKSRIYPPDPIKPRKLPTDPIKSRIYPPDPIKPRGISKTLMSPGLLESDGGFVGQGPAAAGAASTPSGGSKLDVYRAPK